MAWRTLFEAHAVILHRIDSDLTAAGVGSLMDYDVLYTLYLAPERRVRLSELADAVLLSRSGLTRLVDRLERRGLLYRAPSEEDRRGFFAVLTEEGMEEMRRIWKIYEAGIARYFAAALSADEIETVQRLFQRIKDAERRITAPNPGEEGAAPPCPNRK